MAKIKLGSRPKSFKRVVKFPMLDGSEGSVEVTYKYRTRKEFGAFIDSLISKAATDNVPGEDKPSMTDLTVKTEGANADYILAVVEGWNLEEDFNRENIEQLADEIPAAVNAIMDTYRIATTEGRLGN